MNQRPVHHLPAPALVPWTLLVEDDPDYGAWVEQLLTEDGRVRR